MQTIDVEPPRVNWLKRVLQGTETSIFIGGVGAILYLAYLLHSKGSTKNNDIIVVPPNQRVPYYHAETSINFSCVTVNDQEYNPLKAEITTLTAALTALEDNPYEYDFFPWHAFVRQNEAHLLKTREELFAYVPWQDDLFCSPASLPEVIVAMQAEAQQSNP